MDVNNVAEFIKSVGFPIFVAMFVLIRVEKSIERLTVSLTALGEAIHNLPCCPSDKK
jgi:hypothetical protein